jgi:hypothetical protein
MPWDRDMWELGQLLCDAQLMKLARAWKIPLLSQKRIKTIRELFRKR